MKIRQTYLSSTDKVINIDHDSIDVIATVSDDPARIVGDDDNYKAGIDVALPGRGFWYNRVEVYGTSKEDAEDFSKAVAHSINGTNKETQYLKERIEELAKENSQLTSDCHDLAEMVSLCKQEKNLKQQIDSAQSDLGQVENTIKRLQPVFDKHILPF